MSTVQTINLRDSKLALNKKLVNIPQRHNDKLMKSMPRQIDTVVKPIEVPHDMDFFLAQHMWIMVTLDGFV